MQVGDQSIGSRYKQEKPIKQSFYYKFFICKINFLRIEKCRVCVCVCICVYACLYVCVCACMCACMCLWLRQRSVAAYVCLYVCMCACMSPSTCMCLCLRQRIVC